MTKSKAFWVFTAFVSFCAAVFCGYTVYNRLILHFTRDTLEIRPVPMPLSEAGEIGAASDPEAGVGEKNLAAYKEEPPVSKPGEKAKATKEEPQKVKAIKTHFEYKHASAKTVFISGSFTSWKEVKMAKKNGVWQAEVYILPGNYLYHFTVDGKKTLDSGKPKAAVGESIVEVK
ncbi:MAG TPA: hypothetical protein DCL44_01900 [Elusimicrobia bacterium]|nr:hypothetical protein [Elusimicrobiota bacterium]